MREAQRPGARVDTVLGYTKYPGSPLHFGREFSFFEGVGNLPFWVSGRPRGPRRAQHRMAPAEAGGVQIDTMGSSKHAIVRPPHKECILVFRARMWHSALKIHKDYLASGPARFSGIFARAQPLDSGGP